MQLPSRAALPQASLVPNLTFRREAIPLPQLSPKGPFFTSTLPPACRVCAIGRYAVPDRPTLRSMVAQGVLKRIEHHHTQASDIEIVAYCQRQAIGQRDRSEQPIAGLMAPMRPHRGARRPTSSSGFRANQSGQSMCYGNRTSLPATDTMGDRPRPASRSARA